MVFLINLNRYFIWAVFSLDFRKVSGNDLDLEKNLVERVHGNVKIG